MIAAVALAIAVLAGSASPAGAQAAPPEPIHHWTEAAPEVQAALEPEVIQAWIDAYWVGEWVRIYWERIVALTEAYEAALAAPAIPPCTGPGHSACSVEGIEVCNGADLLPCYVLYRESRFNPQAQNPRSSAYGLAQFLYGTWRSVCPEYPHRGSTVAQQVECIRRLWAGGRGRSHWRLTL